MMYVVEGCRDDLVFEDLQYHSGAIKDFSKLCNTNHDLLIYQNSFFQLFHKIEW